MVTTVEPAVFCATAGLSDPARALIEAILFCAWRRAVRSADSWAWRSAICFSFEEILSRFTSTLCSGFLGFDGRMLSVGFGVSTATGLIGCSTCLGSGLGA